MSPQFTQSITTSHCSTSGDCADNMIISNGCPNAYRVTPHDAARYWNRFEADTYDCILLDAPCTSERHVVQQATSLAGKGPKSRWSLHQCKDMAALQVKLLTAALKVGYEELPILQACHFSYVCCTAYSRARTAEKPTSTVHQMVYAWISQRRAPAILTLLAMLWRWSKAFVGTSSCC